MKTAKLSTDKKATIPYIKACNAFFGVARFDFTPKSVIFATSTIVLWRSRLTSLLSVPAI